MSLALAKVRLLPVADDTRVEDIQVWHIRVIRERRHRWYVYGDCGHNTKQGVGLLVLLGVNREKTEKYDDLTNPLH